MTPATAACVGVAVCLDTPPPTYPIAPNPLPWSVSCRRRAAPGTGDGADDGAELGADGAAADPEAAAAAAGAAGADGTAAGEAGGGAAAGGRGKLSSKDSGKKGTGKKAAGKKGGKKGGKGRSRALGGGGGDGDADGESGGGTGRRHEVPDWSKVGEAGSGGSGPSYFMPVTHVLVDTFRGGHVARRVRLVRPVLPTHFGVALLPATQCACHNSSICRIP